MWTDIDCDSLGSYRSKKYRHLLLSHLTPPWPRWVHKSGIPRSSWFSSCCSWRCEPGAGCGRPWLQTSCDCAESPWWKITSTPDSKPCCCFGTHCRYYYDWIQDGRLAVTGVGRDQYRLLRPSGERGRDDQRLGAGTSQWEARLTQPANQSGGSGRWGVSGVSRKEEESKSILFSYKVKNNNF